MNNVYIDLICRVKSEEIKGNLSNDDGDGNENGRNAIGLISKITVLHA